MNESSQEYITRLKVLVEERRIFDEKVLETLLASDRPLNPFAGLKLTTSTLPHSTAFATLLEEDLQWELIRDNIRRLLTKASDDQRRSDDARQETANIIQPELIQHLPFIARVIIKTPDAQTLAVETDGISQSVTLNIYNLTAGTGPASLTFKGSNDEIDIHARTVGPSTVLSLPDIATGRLVSVDLLAPKVLSDPVLSAPVISPEPVPHTVIEFPVHGAVITEKKGTIGVVAFSKDQLFLIDPVTGLPLNTITLPQNMDLFKARTGSVGSVVYHAILNQETLLIDPWTTEPAKSLKSISSITGFSLRGQAFILGEDLNATPDEDTILLKTVNLETGQESATFPLKGKPDTASLLDTFETEGRFYGIIGTDHDACLVDLMNGQVIRTLSQNGIENEVKLNWRPQITGESAFTFKGKRYILARSKLGGDQFKEELLILDALTLLPIGSRYQFNVSLSRVRIIENSDKQTLAVVDTFDLAKTKQTSELLSLIQQAD